MKFTVSGHHNSEPASLTWEDGAVSGPPKAVESLHQLARETVQVEIVGMPIVSRADHLQTPLAALVLMGRALYPVTGTSGQVPELPASEPGDIH